MIQPFNFTFLFIGIELNGNQVCPKDYFSDDAYNKTMDLIHFYNPSWEMCYS